MPPKRKDLLSKDSVVNQLELDPRMSVVDLVDNMATMSFQARNLGRAAKIYERMLTDPDRPTIYLSLTGALIAAGLRRVIRDMVYYGLVDVIVSTGAILYHDFYESLGGHHHRTDPRMDDVILQKLHIDRVYDTLVDEDRFYQTDLAAGQFASTLEPRGYSSREFMSLLSKTVHDEGSILWAATERGTPLFVPAINDSSLGIGITKFYQEAGKRPHMHIDSIQDNMDLIQTVLQSPATSSIYLGGGVPKNYVNDGVIMAQYAVHDDAGCDFAHRYAIQLTMATEHDGGLSGSTLSEAKSWGKIQHEATTQMVLIELSIGLPLIVGYVMGKGLHRGRKNRKFKF